MRLKGKLNITKRQLKNMLRVLEEIIGLNLTLEHDFTCDRYTISQNDEGNILYYNKYTADQLYVVLVHTIDFIRMLR